MSALLRLTPLISSTASLIWAYDEYTKYSAWLDPTYRKQADALLPAWFRNELQKAKYVLFASFPVSLSTGIANVLSLSTSNQYSSWSRESPQLWYGLGAFFALAHMFFAPRALPLLAEIQREGEWAKGAKSPPTDAIGRWLRMHSVRTPTTDLPAVLCFLTGACLALQSV